MIDAALLKQAMSGTDRTPIIGEADSSQLAALTDAIATDDPAWNLLLKAGCWAVAEKAAFQPQTVPVETFPPAEPETWAEMSLPLVEVLTRIVTEYMNHPHIVLYFLKRLAEAQLRLPFETLPKFLVFFSYRTFFREHLAEFTPVLGERGRWLCTQNPAWKDFDFAQPKIDAEFSVTEFEDIWNEGSFRDREAALLQMRQKDPNQARETLAQTWKSEKAEHRETFLQTFRHGLSEADVPFLEDTLKDRGKSVRQVAVQLLSLVPESDFAQRARVRAEELFAEPQAKTRMKGFVDKIRGKKRLEIVPPKTFAQEAKADALEEKPPQGAGQQAWCLFQILSRIPPSHWETRWSMSPEDFLTALSQDDFFVPALQALTQAALLFDQEHWFEPLWNAWSPLKKNFALPPFGSCEEQLTERCMLGDPLKYWRKIQGSGTNMFFKRFHFGTIWQQLVLKQPIPWSDSFSTALLEFIKSESGASESLAHTVALFPETLHEQVQQFLYGKKYYSRAEKHIERGLELRKGFDRLLFEI